jgi:hypothetical protein
LRLGGCADVLARRISSNNPEVPRHGSSGFFTAEDTGQQSRNPNPSIRLTQKSRRAQKERKRRSEQPFSRAEAQWRGETSVVASVRESVHRLFILDAPLATGSLFKHPKFMLSLGSQMRCLPFHPIGRRACAWLVVALRTATAAHAQAARLEAYLPACAEEVSLALSTHVYFTPTEMIVADALGDSFVYREQGGDQWQRSAVPVKAPHSIAYHPGHGLYYASDTQNHRLIAFSNLASSAVSLERHEMAGVELREVHDVAYDESTGWIYALNPYGPTVFRFKELGGEVDKLEFRIDYGYARALTVADSRLYVVVSSLGAIIEVLDWDARQYEVHQSPGHKLRVPAGSWEHSGLVPNDAVYFRGTWYVSNFFSNDHVPDPSPKTDHFKLICFDSWDDFTSGNWEDLSDQLPPAFIPYFFTVHADQLFLAGFFGSSRKEGHDRGRIYAIAPAQQRPSPENGPPDFQPEPKPNGVVQP